MEEILQKLLSSELLTEDVKSEISATWQQFVQDSKTQIREETTLEVRAELAEQWVEEREQLVENMDKFIATKLEAEKARIEEAVVAAEKLLTAKLTEELAELRADIEEYQDLKVTYAKKITEEKAALRATLVEDMATLVDEIDSFLELRLTEEFGELREDIEAARTNDFGARIYEAFATEFGRTFKEDESSIAAKLEAESRKLREAEQVIARLEALNESTERSAKMASVLAPLSGAKREQMEFILSSVSTDRLEEAYTRFIGRVLKEDSSSEAKVITESAPAKPTQVVTGEPAAAKVTQSSEKNENLRRLAGIVK